MRKFGIILDENGRIHFCRRICTVYEVSRLFDEDVTINLYNLCYVKATDSFVFNKALDLPKRLIKRYDGATSCIDSKVKEMNAIGILDISLIREKIDLFEEFKDFMSYSEYRDKVSGKSKNSISYVEVIESLSQLRQSLIMVAEDNSSIFKIELKDV